MGYKPAERKCIDVVRKEFKTKEMQAYLRRVKRMKLPEENVNRNTTILSKRGTNSVYRTNQNFPQNPHIRVKPMVLLAKSQTQKVKKPSLQSHNKNPSKNLSKTGVKSPANTKAMHSISQSSKKRPLNEKQPPANKKRTLNEKQPPPTSNKRILNEKQPPSNKRLLNEKQPPTSNRRILNEKQPPTNTRRLLN